MKNSFLLVLHNYHYVLSAKKRTDPSSIYSFRVRNLANLRKHVLSWVLGQWHVRWRIKGSWSDFWDPSLFVCLISVITENCFRTSSVLTFSMRQHARHTDGAITYWELCQFFFTTFSVLSMNDPNDGFPFNRTFSCYCRIQLSGKILTWTWMDGTNRYLCRIQIIKRVFKKFWLD